MRRGPRGWSAVVLSSPGHRAHSTRNMGQGVCLCFERALGSRLFNTLAVCRSPAAKIVGEIASSSWDAARRLGEGGSFRWCSGQGLALAWLLLGPCLALCLALLGYAAERGVERLGRRKA